MAERESRYERLKNRQRPVHEGDEFSLRHPKMPPEKRAKIFQPFDALRGFSAEIDIAKENAAGFEENDGE